jgi:hypothetical protein
MRAAAACTDAEDLGWLDTFGAQHGCSSLLSSRTGCSSAAVSGLPLLELHRYSDGVNARRAPCWQGWHFQIGAQIVHPSFDGSPAQQCAQLSLLLACCQIKGCLCPLILQLCVLQTKQCSLCSDHVFGRGVCWPLPGCLVIPAGSQLPIHTAALCWSCGDRADIHSGESPKQLCACSCIFCAV